MPVVAVGSHDTASAVVGVPMQTDDAAYVSLGTWALAGLELDAPVLTEEARAASLTNEGGVDGTVRFLSNVMGTWLLSETLRTWGETDLTGMLRAAAAYDVSVPIVDVQDELFLAPGDMQARIGYWCHEHGVAPPRGRVEAVRCIVLSIAAAIATALKRAGDLAGRHHRRRARRRRRFTEHLPVPGDRGPYGPAGAGRAGRGDRARQRARPGPRGRASSARASRTSGRWSPAPTTWRGSTPRA